jgi:hypothetical protein
MGDEARFSGKGLMEEIKISGFVPYFVYCIADYYWFLSRALLMPSPRRTGHKNQSCADKANDIFVFPEQLQSSYILSLNPYVKRIPIIQIRIAEYIGAPIILLTTV